MTDYIVAARNPDGTLFVTMVRDPRDIKAALQRGMPKLPHNAMVDEWRRTAGHRLTSSWRHMGRWTWELTHQ